MHIAMVLNACICLCPIVDCPINLEKFDGFISYLKGIPFNLEPLHLLQASAGFISSLSAEVPSSMHPDSHLAVAIAAHVITTLNAVIDGWASCRGSVMHRDALLGLESMLSPMLELWLQWKTISGVGQSFSYATIRYCWLVNHLQGRSQVHCQ